MKATLQCPPTPRPPPWPHGGHLRRRHHAAPAAGAAWSARRRGQHALRTPQHRFLATPPQPRPPRAAARLPVGGARDGAATTPAFGAQAAQQATRRQQAVHRRGLAARRRVSASASRRSACVRFSARHSACSASASVAAPRCRCPVRSSQPLASLHRRSRLAHVHRLQAHVVKTAAPPPPSPPPRLTRRRQHPPLPAHVAPSAPRTRRAALSATACAAARFPSLPPPRLHLRALQPPQSRLLRGTAAPPHDAQPHAPPIHPPSPPRQSQAGTARQRAQPPTQPLALHPSSAQLPDARAAHGSPDHGILALRRITTATAALRPASLRRSHENLLQRWSRALAPPHPPPAPPPASRRSCASPASVAPARAACSARAEEPSQPSQPHRRRFQSLARRSSRSKHAQCAIQHHAANALASSRPGQRTRHNFARADSVSPSVAASHRTAQPLSAPPQRIHAPPPPPTATPRQPNPPAARHPPINAPIHPPEHPLDCFTPHQRTTRQRRCCPAPAQTVQRPSPHAQLPAARRHPLPHHGARSCCARCAPTLPA
jgi:hypothetical protein